MAKKALLLFVCAGLTLFSLAGCASLTGASASKEWTVALTPKLDESLRKYTVPQEQTWGDEKVTVYFLDPLRFEEFKAELDAGGEYLQADSWTNDKRDWDRGKDLCKGVYTS